MKSYLLIFIFLILHGCGLNGGRSVYWCGDHPCINKKEKEAYFKEYMVVEIKRLKKDSNKKDSEIEKLIEQAKINQKKKITSDKELSKQAKLDEKKRLKEEKKLLKQAKLDEELDRAIEAEEEKQKQKKTIDKKVTEISKITSADNTLINTNAANLSEFDEVVEKITAEDRPYPEINDIPN